MRNGLIQTWSVLFLCTLGWICVDPAIGADEPAPDAAEATEVSDEGIFAEGAEASADEGLPEGQEVSMGTFGQIDLHIKDLELTNVLQILSVQSQRNIVASKNVSGSISADLYGVDFYEALEAILHTNGFGYREKGNFIYVYTAEELAALEEVQRELTTRLVKLNYTTASDMSTYITPLLSQSGSVAVSGETTQGFQPSLNDAGENSSAHGDMLLIRDFAEHVDEIVSVISQIDTRPEQVLVEATVLNAQLNEANAFGTDLSILMDYKLGDFLGSPLNVVDSLIGGQTNGANTPLIQAIGPGQALQSTAGNTATGDSTFKFGVINSNIAAFVRMLDRVTDTTVVARPKLLVLNRQKAELLVGSKLGYISTTATETASTQTVEFLEVGTQLTVRPFVSNDGYIRMELRPSVSDGFTRAVGAFVIPEETTNELTTNVIVRNGQTVVLGGLFKEDTIVTREQVPFVGDIPILGAAFKGHDDSTLRTEVIFLITPTIMKDQSMYAAGDDAADQIEHVRVGARQQLLPWSRDKLTSSHMQEAMKHYKAGDMEKAEWAVNKALNLDPSMISALKLKEEITGNRPFAPQRSILNDVINSMVEEAAAVTEPMQDPAANPAGVQLDAKQELDADAIEAGIEMPGDDTEADYMVVPLVDEADDAPADAEPVSNEIVEPQEQADTELDMPAEEQAAPAEEEAPADEPMSDAGETTEGEWVPVPAITSDADLEAQAAADAADAEPVAEVTEMEPAEDAGEHAATDEPATEEQAADAETASPEETQAVAETEDDGVLDVIGTWLPEEEGQTEDAAPATEE